MCVGFLLNLLFFHIQFHVLHHVGVEASDAEKDRVNEVLDMIELSGDDYEEEK